MYPIKYVENSLVFNQERKCSTYYKLIPCNYSFLSPEQRYQVHDNFRQLIAQNREDRIYTLQIATENSIRATQERSKKEITGRLTEVAKQQIDLQIEALASMIGDSQIDYRFFIGFKLIATDEEVNLKNLKKSFFSGFQEFAYGVNHHLVGDFVSLSNEEIRRYTKLEKLMESKLTRRFKVRRVTPSDLMYLIGHIYGEKGTSLEEYEFQLPKKKLKSKTLVKRYDLSCPSRCSIEEKPQYLCMEHENHESCVVYLTINTIAGEVEFPSSELFYYQQQQSAFPINTSMNVEIVTNKKALATVRNRKKELKDLDNHAYQSSNETNSNVLDALDSVDELETTLDQSEESMYRLSHVVRVSAESVDELKRWCNEALDFYDDTNVKLVRPFGDTTGLHEEFLPSSKRHMNDYIQYVTSDFLAGLGFGATRMLGELEGICFGYNVDAGRNVYLKPALASQGIKGPVTNALAVAFLGSFGGGKSFSNNLLVYYATPFGGQAVIVDPKGERDGWRETLPEIADGVNILNLTSKPKNQGLLDPYVIMEKKENSKSLAIDILTFLTGVSSRGGEEFPVLRKAIRTATQSNQRGLLQIINELRKGGSPVAENIADHIESFTDYNFAHLLFSDGPITQSTSLDRQLNVIQVADLVLPDAETTFEEYTTVELLSVSMLIVISTFALDFTHSNREIFKIVDLNKAWSFLRVAQGKTLSNKLACAGWVMNAGVYLVTQNSDDLLDERLKNNIGLKFVFRSADIHEIKKTLEFSGLDREDKGSQKHLRDLENDQCLIQDLYGRVDVVQVYPTFEELFHTFDTRPPVQERME